MRGVTNYDCKWNSFLNNIRFSFFSLQLKSTNTELVSSFKYLGNLITSARRSSPETKQRIGQAKTAFINKNTILVSKKIRRAIKKSFLKTFVWSVAFYGCGTWVINETEKWSLEAFEMWDCRRMEKFNWTEQLKDENRQENQETRTYLNWKRRRDRYLRRVKNTCWWSYKMKRDVKNIVNQPNTGWIKKKKKYWTVVFLTKCMRKTNRKSNLTLFFLNLIYSPFVLVNAPVANKYIHDRNKIVIFDWTVLCLITRIS